MAIAPTIIWFRRDLRLADNPALIEASRRGPVLPLFVHDPVLSGRSGGNRLAYLHASLDALDRSMGGALVERVGNPANEVAKVAAECGAAIVLAAEDFGPYGRRRDQAVARRVELRLVGSPYAVAPGSVFTKAGTPFRVFTPFARAWRTNGWDDPQAVPDLVGHRGLASHPRPLAPAPTATAGLPAAGESAAWEVADRFLSKLVDGYDLARDRPDLDETSRLSAHLKVGSLHPRQLLAELGDRAGPATFASELAWRDFYADVVFHRPDTLRANFASTMDGLRWDTGPDADRRFDAWCAGATGYPMVDAGMRQLLAEGWMHNRVRMIAASFLVKDLHIDWRRGAAWFMAHLFDGDVASNAHGWQWTAGTGTDASPFFRVFNPVAQGERCDPNGDYVRRYVPELAAVPGAAVHRPDRSVGGLFSVAGVDYPAPIVDHSTERLEALSRYQHRQGS